MRKSCWMIGLLLALLLSACGPASNGEGTTEPSGATPADADTFPRATLTPPNAPAPGDATALPEGYPGPPTLVPSPEGYPPPATPLPTLDPYPAGGLVWILRPVGEQCADPEDNTYTSLQDAVAALAAAGISASSSGIVELMVCSACGCPTSSHYRVQISASDLDRAAALGWIEEE